jgi:hypothetical protein
MFGAPIGGLLDFESYLYADVVLPSVRVSCMDGGDVVVLPEIRPDASVASYDKLLRAGIAKAPQVSINDAKDIDSLARAMGEIAVFAGNIIQGQCSHIEKSNRVLDSHFIYGCHNVVYSKYAAFCRRVKYSESVFGIDSTSKVRLALKSTDIYGATGLFECLRVYTSANCYYCSNMDDSHDCLFSFNQRSARRKIGNLELPLDKFSVLKEKLIGEMRETLASKKKAVSVLDIIGGANA